MFFYLRKKIKAKNLNQKSYKKVVKILDIEFEIFEAKKTSMPN